MPRPPQAARVAAGRAGILIPFVATLVILASLSPPFLRPQNLANILDQQAGIIIVAAAGHAGAHRRRHRPVGGRHLRAGRL